MRCLLNTCKLPDTVGWRDMLAGLEKWRWFLHFYILKLTIGSTIEFALRRWRDDDRCICLASLHALLIFVCWKALKIIQRLDKSPSLQMQLVCSSRVRASGHQRVVSHSGTEARVTQLQFQVAPWHAATHRAAPPSLIASTHATLDATSLMEYVRN